MNSNIMAAKLGENKDISNTLDFGFASMFGAASPVDTGESKYQVVELPIAQLFDFGYYDPHRSEMHCFRPYPPDKLQAFADKIAGDGVLNPLLVRKRTQTEYEVLAGHNRRDAAKLAGKETVPCIVLDVDDDQAVIIMTSTNLEQRDTLPSEKGWAFRLELETRKRQGKRTDLTSSHFETKLSSCGIMSESAGMSRANIYRHIRLTYLIPDFSNMVDDGTMLLGISENLSYLTKPTQVGLAILITQENIKLTPELSMMLKAAFADRDASEEDLRTLLRKPVRAPKKDKPVNIKLAPAKYSRYFSGKKPKEVEALLETILDEYFQRREDAGSKDDLHDHDPTPGN